MINYFDFYELPVKFNLSEQELKQKYFKLLKTNHPDFFIDDPIKYQEALLNSSQNNKAYQCLKDFYSRSHHILDLSDIVLNDNLSPAFLMEMMDINESLAELQSVPDVSEWQKMQSDISGIEKDIEHELSILCKKADQVTSFSEMPLPAIKENLLKHKYILRLKETLANIAPSK